MTAGFPPEWRNVQVPPKPPAPRPGGEDRTDWAALHCAPLIHPSAWVAPGAVVLGRVRILARASVWYGCVLRGDEEYIDVGEETNLQDGAILHVDHGCPCRIGNRVTLGHGAVVHGAVVRDGALIAIRATVLSRCDIGEGAVIAAGAVVTEGTIVPPRTLWVGCPARQLKELGPEHRERIEETCRHYVNNAALFLARFGR